MSKVRPGMFIGERYEIIALIGSGGTADVYKAKDHRLNRFVAVKILKENFTGDKKTVEKFQQEAQACAGLAHPNIVSVFDVGNAGDLHYIVMELIDGITLKKFIERKGRLEVKEAIGIAIQIAQGLDAAHANHIVHRDIKPQNIIISREGKVKVTDFGIARATLGTSSNTLNQAPVGSVHYLSPEQARGGFSDERSDIYSLGVTIYEMLAGKVPFTGDNNVSVALLQIQGEATPLHEINPDVTPSVEKIVAKCMQKKPERRYFSASELIKDLKVSISDPSGSFVKLGRGVVDSSPTRNISEDEMNQIKNQVHSSANDFEEDSGVFGDDDDDDDDIDSANTKTEKMVIIGSIALVGIVLAFIIFFAVRSGVFGSKSSESGKKLTGREIEKLLDYGYTIDKMQTTLEDMGITYVPQRKYSDDVAKDYVINMYYDEDGNLVVEYSLGPMPAETKKMPNLLGKNKDVAVSELGALSEGFQIKVVPSTTHSEEDENTIIAQSIAKDTEISMDAEIVLTYSIGPELIEISSQVVNGEYTWSMMEEIYGEKFNLVKEYDTENSYSATVKGVIVKVSPEAGKKYKKNSTVTVYLASDYVLVPDDYVGSSQETAEAGLKKVGLKVQIEEVYTDKDDAGTVISQSISKGEQVDRGTTVKIQVSKGIEPTPVPTHTPTPTSTSTPTPTEEQTGPEKLSEEKLAALLAANPSLDAMKAALNAEGVDYQTAYEASAEEKNTVIKLYYNSSDQLVVICSDGSLASGGGEGGA